MVYLTGFAVGQSGWICGGPAGFAVVCPAGFAVGLSGWICGWSVWLDLRSVCLAGSAVWLDLRLVSLAGFAVGQSSWICGWSVWLDVQLCCLAGRGRLVVAALSVETGRQTTTCRALR